MFLIPRWWFIIPEFPKGRPYYSRTKKWRNSHELRLVLWWECQHQSTRWLPNRICLFTADNYQTSTWDPGKIFLGAAILNVVYSGIALIAVELVRNSIFWLMKGAIALRIRPENGTWEHTGGWKCVKNVTGALPGDIHLIAVTVFQYECIHLITVTGFTKWASSSLHFRYEFRITILDLRNR